MKRRYCLLLAASLITYPLSTAVRDVGSGGNGRDAAVSHLLEGQCSADDFYNILEDEMCYSDLFADLAIDSDIVVQGEKAAESASDAYFASLLRFPTAGQRLMLVDRNSPLMIQLEDDVTYQLRQRQQIHNIKNDDLIDMFPWEKSQNRIFPELSELVVQHDNNHSTHRKALEREFSKGELVPLLLKSHPGQAIIPLQMEPIGGGFMLEQNDYVDLGIGRKEDAVQIRLRQPQVVSRMGDPGDAIRRYALVSEGGSLMIASSNELVHGSPISMTSWLSVVNDDEAHGSEVADTQYYTDLDYRCPVIVNKDGSLSPFEAQHLAVGISPHPAVTLVERYSPQRLIFQYADTFFKTPAPVNGTPLVLTSHPGLAIVSGQHYRGAYGLANIVDVGVAPVGAVETLRLYPLDNLKHHQFTLRNEGGMTLAPMNLRLELDAPLRLVKYNVSQSKLATMALSFLTRMTQNATWVVNSEGSISPVNAPHLTLGCKHLSDFVDKQFAAKQRLIWKQHGGANSVETVGLRLDRDDLRLVHTVFWILFSEGHFQHITLMIVLVLIILVKLVPLPIWMTLVFRLWLGMTASLLFLGFQIGYLLTKAALKRYKAKRNSP